MGRVRTTYKCFECGAEAAKWAGRCPGCGNWNTLHEELAPPPDASGAAGARARVRPPRLTPPASAMPIGEVDVTAWVPRPTGIDELDRVLGGGLVPGSVTLIGGEPGIGKSTLLLQALAAMAGSAQRCLLVSAEESAQQVRMRAERLGALHPRLWLLAETELPSILTALDEVAPVVAVVDSIQTVFDPELSSAPGTVTQVRECTHRLVRVAKERDLAIVVVGHVTKDGALAGPRVLEHVVDTVLSFEGERHHALRLLRATKHRFGSTNELGLFEMTGTGLEGVPDAGALFLADRRPGVPGSVIVPTLEGQRPLLVELQALVATTTIPNPRRSAQGVDGGRLALLLAVLERELGLKLSNTDVFALAVGGVRVVEPGADLGLALAVASSSYNRPLPDQLVACGEIGLGGELRLVGQTPRRLAEAARLGFTTAVVPQSAPDPPPGVRAIRAATLAEAVGRLGLDGQGLSRGISQ
jgi:DNA repair protein RadA/Sms